MSQININGNFTYCYRMTVLSRTNNGVWNWKAQDALIESLPLFFSQLFIILFLTRLFFYLLKPLHQPPLIAEILAGFTVGALGRHQILFIKVFAERSIMVTETIAYLGLLFYVFLTGLEMDLSAILRPGKRVMGIAITGILIPFLVGVGLFSLLHQDQNKITSEMGCVFWAATLTITGFPVLTRILADLKLLHSDIGRIAMSVAMLNDIYAWVLIAILIPTDIGMEATAQSLIGIITFVLICFFAVRPLLERIIRIESEKDNYSEYHLCFVLAGAMICACITDLLGAQSIVGAFVFGLIMPNGEFGDVLLDRLDDFVSGIMLPFFFMSWGMKIEFKKIVDDTTWFVVILVICFACMAKILSSLTISILLKMPLRDGAALGVLMNTKGILALVILNTGRNKKILNEQQFAVMAVAMVAMTIVVAPIMSAIYKHRKGLKQYRLRTIQRQKPDTELRVLTCVHTTANVSGIISLLQVSHATKLSPITIFALHLVELTGRASAMLIVHSHRKSGAHNPSRAQADSNLIINAFEAFERDNHLVTVQPLTAMSLYSTMHEDICSLAQDKRVSLILLPFHKHLTVGGRMEDENVAYRDINLNVLANAPCSVGIFIDRGLAAADISVKCHFCMLFIGGGDDREALAYAWRMAGHPGISLTVVRFLPGEDAMEHMEPVNDIEGHRILSFDIADNDKEAAMDEDYINEFRFKSASDESIMFLEKVVNNGEETVSEISAMDNSYDLYIVGKGTGKVSPLLSGLSEWSDCPELGVIGDVLMSSTFALQASVLVVQQYGSGGGTSEESRRDRFGLRQRMMGVLRSSQSGKGMVLSDSDWPLGNA